MKTLAAILLIMSAPVMANEKCKTVSDYAEAVMGSRQAGVPMVEMIGIAKSELGKMMIIEAYGRPRFGTEPFKEKEIADFRDKWYLWCIQAMV